MPRGGTFPIDSSKDDKAPELNEHEKELLDKVAKKVVYWKMTVPAIMALESVKPMNYIGAQAMVFFEPIVQALFNFQDYDTFRQMMERRQTLEDLLQRIEHFDAIAYRKEKKFRKLKREYLKKQSLGFRVKSAIVGFKVPRHLEEQWKAEIEAASEPKKPEDKK